MPGSGTETGGGAIPARAVAESIETINPVMRYFIMNLPYCGLIMNEAFSRPMAPKLRESITWIFCKFSAVKIFDGSTSDGRHRRVPALKLQTDLAEMLARLLLAECIRNIFQCE